METVKEKFYNLLLEGEDSVKEALAILNDKSNAALKKEVEGELIPVLKTVGRKTLRSLPKFMKTISESFSDLAEEEQFVWLEKCPILLEAIKETILILGESRSLILLGKLKNIEKLYLEIYDDQFEQLPESLGGFKYLEKLEISSEEFIKLPNSITQLESLRELSLSIDQLESIPETVFKLKSLEELEVVNSDIKILTASIAQLKKLRSLNLRDNKLKALPEAIQELENLSYLELKRNEFTEQPSVLSRIKSLKSNDLGHLPLEEEVEQVITTGKEPTKEEQVAIYTLLESRSEENLQKALGLLENNTALKNKAEQRYLKFIQTRTNNDTATLADINKAAFSEAEVSILLKSLKGPRMDTISMYDLQDNKLKYVADFGGSLVANHLDVKAYLAHAKVFTNEPALLAFIKKTEAKLLERLEKEAAVYTEGWFGQLYAHFMGLKYTFLGFDHVSDCGFNDSSLLNEFWIFLSLFLGESQSLTIDVFQATGIDIMPATFLMKQTPSYRVQEGRMDVTSNYPLLVERTISCGGPDIFYSVKAPKYPMGKISLYKTYH
ncbi:MAG: leucine-rich repeat domain-containing protein [Saprospiraceae bacterium]|nr:leucine-rich repeat domain-containing protein [Saprospiraceae bacterium]